MEGKNYSDTGKTVAIITSSRPDYLESLASSVGRNIIDHGHDIREWNLLVVDNSPERYAKQNIDVLRRINPHLGMPAFYLGESEFEQLVQREGPAFKEMFSGHGCPDLRNLVMLAATDKTLVLLDDDMALTQSVLYEQAANDYPALLSTGRFVSLDDFPKVSYREPFDLVTATTSELGKKAGEVSTNENLRGKAVGSRDQVIDYLMSGMAVNRSSDANDNYCYCHVEPGAVNPDAIIRWQGLAAVTEKADCHATASMIGLSMATDASVIQYGNLFVNYAVHRRPLKVAIVNDWKESSMAAFGILNTDPLPSYPLPRNEDVAYRHMISENNPIALVNIGVDHNRSLTGRPRLSVIYFNEIMGAKICRNLRSAVNGTVGHWNLSNVEGLHKDQKKHLLKSMKATCATLDTVRKNGNPEMAQYADKLITDISNLFSHAKLNGEAFWLEQTFKDRVHEVAEEYFRNAISTSQVIFDRWPGMVENVRKHGIPVTRI